MRLRQIVAVLMLLAPSSWAVATETDCLFVEAAKLDSAWLPATTRGIIPADLNAVHRVVSGSGTVVLVRAFSEQKGNELDSEEFWKLTVDLPSMAIGERHVLQANAANTRFSRAGSAWIAEGFGYVGGQVSGTVVAQRVDRCSMTVDMSLDIETRFAGDPEESRPLAIHRKATLRRIELANLTPWLGSATADGMGYWVSHRPKDLPLTCSDVQ